MGDINRCAHCSRPVFHAGAFCDSLCRIEHYGVTALRRRMNTTSVLIRRIGRRLTGGGLP